MGKKYLLNQTRNGVVQICKYSITGEVDNINSQEVKNIGNSLGIDWEEISLAELTLGTQTESNEHSDIVGSNTEKALRIALAHIKEIPDYYQRLKRMESEKEQPKLRVLAERLKAKRNGQEGNSNGKSKLQVLAERLKAKNNGQKNTTDSEPK